MSVKIGTQVRYKMGDELFRLGTSTGSGKRSWQRTRDGYGAEAGSADTIVSGFIVGVRTLSNGQYTRGWSSQSYEGEWDGEPDEYHVKETFQAYLIARSLRSTPVRVRVEDVDVVDAPTAAESAVIEDVR